MPGDKGAKMARQQNDRVNFVNKSQELYQSSQVVKRSANSQANQNNLLSKYALSEKHSLAMSFDKQKHNKDIEAV